MGGAGAPPIGLPHEVAGLCQLQHERPVDIGVPVGFFVRAQTNLRQGPVEAVGRGRQGD